MGPIKNILNYEYYEKYINGEITAKELAIKSKIPYTSLPSVLKREGLPSHRKYVDERVKGDFFDKIDTEEKAYILGFYVADGAITRSKKCDNWRFSIGLNEDDKEILEKIKNIMNPYVHLIYEVFDYKKTSRKTRPMYKFQFSNKNICTKLEEYGLGFNKTYKEKSVKNIIPEELMKHFIRGYFDGDGCTCLTKGEKKIKTKNGIKNYCYQNAIWSIISKDSNILYELKEFFDNKHIHTVIYPDARNCFLLSCTTKKFLGTIYLLSLIIFYLGNYIELDPNKRLMQSEMAVFFVFSYIYVYEDK